MSGIKLKSPEEILLLAEGGKILASILTTLQETVKPGVLAKDLDVLARQLCEKYNVKPAFLNYAPPGHTPYPQALCISINDAVVHGLVTDEVLQEGDIISLDMGIIYKDLFLDSARTLSVGIIAPEAQQLLTVTKEALQAGIAAAKPGNTIGHVSQAIEDVINPYGYGIVRQLVGHGVGYAVHEEPQVPNVGEAGDGPILEPGLVIAIEPMVTMGDYEVVVDADDWTVRSSDGSLSAHEEHTIAITENGPTILTI